MQQRYYRRTNMDFKEVKLMDGDQCLSPVVIASSIYTKDGESYIEHSHDNKYYTKSEINAMLSETGTTYTYTGN